jgi:internalin A
MPLNFENRQFITELQALLPKGFAFVETRLELIIPMGASGYAVNKSGEIVGIKVGALRSNADAFFQIISKLKKLRRLVIYISEKSYLPNEISTLTDLEFIWLAGNIVRLPQEIFSLNLPVKYTESGGLVSLSHILGEESILLLEDFERKFQNRRNKLREARNETKEDFDLNLKLEGQREIEFEESSREIEKELLKIWEAFDERFRQDLTNINGVVLVKLELLDPPIEIVTKGDEAIKRYFSEIEKDSLPLNELKILLVGNGAAGKTSLVKSIFNEDFDLEEAQTHGINIRSKVLTSKGETIRVNFWDFGGQEIMHATHQFFLSKRSMYILVLDGRKEEDPEYWLQHIESFGGDSPVLVVLNKIDENPSFDVNRRFLKAKYKGIIDFFRVSCATKEGLEDFQQRLSDELRTVNMIQTQWPRSWFKVKRKLENLGTAYITLDAYKKICEAENIEDEKTQELLVDFLNDLGVVLHFKDIALLDTHVLDPRWVTEAVYRIINSELLAKQKGIIHFHHLEKALKPRKKGECVYPRDKHLYIVDLMLKFELCYRISNNSILIPDLIDIQEPAIVFETKESLNFVIEYSYFPKSIMTRFIVRMHGDIKNNMKWRTGVLLEDKTLEATALVSADENAKKIFIAVTGKQKRDYFAVIRKVIREINSTFEKIEVKEFIPLPDQQEILVEYIDLIGHEVNGKEEIFIGRLGKSYNVISLLNGIEKPLTRRESMHKGILIQGDYYNQSGATVQTNVTTNQVNDFSTNNFMNHTTKNWERIVVYVTGFLFVGVICFLAIRNQPFADKNLVVMLRIILSIVIAIFGATVPGMLRVDFSAKGLTIRAMGALALFVISYILTPNVL